MAAIELPHETGVAALCKTFVDGQPWAEPLKGRVSQVAYRYHRMRISHRYGADLQHVSVQLDAVTIRGVLRRKRDACRIEDRLAHVHSDFVRVEQAYRHRARRAFQTHGVAQRQCARTMQPRCHATYPIAALARRRAVRIPDA